jgi:two-component system response regulator FixJ
MEENTALEQVPCVLVVDDDAAVRSSLEFSLAIEGFRVFSFAGPREVLEMADLPGRGCLVIDFNLPDMNGFELVTELRRRKIALPAILITTYLPIGVRERAAAAGMRIIEKPLLGNLLTESIREALACG